MNNIHEAFKILNSFDDELPQKIITIDIQVEPDSIVEGLPSGIPNANYDEQTIEDWHNFIGNIEEIIEIENEYYIINTIQSNQYNKFSYYIDFLIKDDNDNYIEECIIELRISDHASNNNINSKRKHHLRNRMENTSYTRFKLYGITINDRLYHSYDDALRGVRTLLDNVNADNSIEK